MPRGTKQRLHKVRTTVRLPRSLYDEIRRLVEENSVMAGTFNDFLISALQAYLKMLKRKRIDAAFAGMAADSEYQREAGLIAEEFANSDWEALAMVERE